MGDSSARVLSALDPLERHRCFVVGLGGALLIGDDDEDDEDELSMTGRVRMECASSRSSKTDNGIRVARTCASRSWIVLVLGEDVSSEVDVDGRRVTDVPRHWHNIVRLCKEPCQTNLDGVDTVMTPRDAFECLRDSQNPIVDSCSLRNLVVAA